MSYRASLSLFCRLLQASTTASAVRIRENQRKARARRKELIDDLRRRTHDYEIQGVMATAHVQEAARKVLLENRRLRALLVEKGVLAAEIEASLYGCRYDASVTPAPANPASAHTIDTQSQAALSAENHQSAPMHASHTTDQLVSVGSPRSMPVPIRPESASRPAKDGISTRSSGDTKLLRPGEQSEKDGSPLLKPLGNVSDCYCPDIEPVPGEVQSPETECSVAAKILAGFRGHGDAEQALVELGCPNTAPCSITNAALLHTLDLGM